MWMFILSGLIGCLPHATVIEGMLQSTCHGDDEVAIWLQRLENPDPDVRAPALDELRRLGPKVIPDLTRLLGKDNPITKQAVLQVLKTMGPQAKDAVPTLIQVLELEKSKPIRRAAVEALGAIGPEAQAAVPSLISKFPEPGLHEVISSSLVQIGFSAVTELTKALEDPQYKIRRGAARTLQRMSAISASKLPPPLDGTREAAMDALIYHLSKLTLSSLPPHVKESWQQALHALARSLHDPDEGVRRAAAWAVGNMIHDAPFAVPALIELLADEDENVRAAAREALKGTILSIRPQLFQALKHPDSHVCRGAALVLGAFDAEPRSAEDVPALLAALESQPDRDTRILIAHLFEGIGEGAIPALIQGLDHPNRYVRHGASQGLKLIPSESAIPKLINALTHPDADVRANVIDALGRNGPKAKLAIPGLVKALGDPIAHLRAEAALALGKIRAQAPEAVTALCKALRDTDPEVRNQAVWALGRVGPTAQEIIPLLVDALHDKSPDVRRSATLALGELGSAARVAIPNLLDAHGKAHYWDSQGQLIRPRNEAGGSQAEIEDALLSVVRSRVAERKLFSDAELGDAIAELKWVEATLSQQARGPSNTVQRLQEERTALEVEQQARSGFWRYVLPGSILLITAAGAVVYLTSGRVQRLVARLYGWRWQFRPGVAAHQIIISRLPGGQRVRVDFVSGGQVFLLDHQFQPSHASPEFAKVRELVRGTRVKVEVVEPEFRKPWAHAVGGKLGDRQAPTIAGQICLQEKLRKVYPTVPNIVFAGIGCEEPAGPPELQSLKFAGPLEWAGKVHRLQCRLGWREKPTGEIDLVTERFRLWGASILPLPPRAKAEATTADLCEALTKADVVHVCAHASPKGIFLRDGIMRKAHLRGLLDKMRCRLLVLSACDIGDISELRELRPLVFPLVLHGVNILAATQPLYNRAALTFFRGFYAGMLPKRKTVGVELAEAVRGAVAECLPAGSEVRKRWTEDINSMILYGDPTVHLWLGQE